MWIAKPRFIGGGLGNWMSSLTSSHPDPVERIATIDAVARGQSVDLALSKQTQSSATIGFAGLLATVLVVVPGYWVGTNPLGIGDYSGGYSTDSGYDDGTGGGGSDGTYDDGYDDSYDGYYEEEVNPDADGGLGDGSTSTEEEVPADDATGGIGEGSTDDSGDVVSEEPDASGGIG
jgi:hypothetical protein